MIKSPGGSGPAGAEICHCHPVSKIIHSIRNSVLSEIKVAKSREHLVLDVEFDGHIPHDILHLFLNSRYIVIFIHETVDPEAVFRHPFFHRHNIEIRYRKIRVRKYGSFRLCCEGPQIENIQSFLIFQGFLLFQALS